MAIANSTTELPPRQKQCTKCLEIKDVSEFDARKKMRDGLRKECKACRRAAVRARHAAHPEKIAAYKRLEHARHRAANNAKSRAYHAANRDVMNAQSRVYHAANRDVSNAKRRAYRETHYNTEIATARAYYATNCETLTAQLREHRAEHPEEVHAKERAYFLAHPGKAAAKNLRRRARILNAPYIEDVSVEVLMLRDKGLCGICHTHVRRKDASVDHIIPVTYGGETSYRNTQLAHKRCNSKRGNRNKIPVQMRLLG